MKTKNNITMISPSDCCGCGMCAEICPRKCISLIENEEGFLVPAVDEEKCIECGKCLKWCAEKVGDNCFQKNKDAFLAYNKDDNTRMKSSSGGVFYSLSVNVINKGGVVYGAAFNESCLVEHIRVDKKTQVDALLGSKYVQSLLTEKVYESVLRDLNNGILVLFSGTPCQVAAMRTFVSKSCTNSIILKIIYVDFVCHGVPSPGVWKSYLSYVSKDDDICGVAFRDKSRGWHDYHLKIEHVSGKTYKCSHDLDKYMHSFLMDKNIRPSCYACKYKGDYFCSDITLGDAWKIEKEKMEWADDKGTSFLVARSEQGKSLLNSLSSEIAIVETNYDKWAVFNPSLVERTVCSQGREDFFNAFKNMETNMFWKKYNKLPQKRVIRYYLKQLVKRMGLESVLRKYLH